MVTWLVTRNTHVKYQSSNNHYSKVIKRVLKKNQGHRVKNVGTLRKVLFVCLFAWSFTSHLRIFYSYGDFTIAGEWLQIWTYARHSWPLSSEGSLTRHGASVYNGHLWRMTLTPITERLIVELSQNLFLRLRSVAAGIRTLNLPLVRWTLYPTVPTPRFGKVLSQGIVVCCIKALTLTVQKLFERLKFFKNRSNSMVTGSKMLVPKEYPCHWKYSRKMLKL